MDVYLIRHADASSRTHGSRDVYRQLSDQGWDQARRIADFFIPFKVSAVLSSPATRCTQTVEPLAARAEVSVEDRDGLWEDVGIDDVFDVLDAACRPLDDSAVIVACSHGNLIPAVVEHLAVNGAIISGRGCERASMWRLRQTDGIWTEAQYLTPRLDYQI